MDERNFITNELSTANEPITVKCRECGEDFTIDAEEKTWYAEKSYDLPQRCPACRKMRRRLKGAYNSGMKRAIRDIVSSVSGKESDPK